MLQDNDFHSSAGPAARHTGAPSGLVTLPGKKIEGGRPGAEEDEAAAAALLTPGSEAGLI